MTVHRSLSRTIRNKFIAGLVILIPIVLTVKALWWLFTYIDSLAAPLGVGLVGRPIPGIGFVLTIAVVLLAGILFSSGPLQTLLHALEELVDSVPVVGSVYGTTKKVLSGFGKPDAQGAFKRFVFARMPGRTAPGFVTSTFHFTRGDTTYAMCTVYVPTNHLYVGDVVVIPEEDVMDTNLSVEDGVSIILSAGSSMPRSIVER